MCGDNCVGDNCLGGNCFGWQLFVCNCVDDNCLGGNRFPAEITLVLKFLNAISNSIDDLVKQ